MLKCQGGETCFWLHFNSVDFGVAIYKALHFIIMSTFIVLY